jgi:hypothetical protein
MAKDTGRAWIGAAAAHRRFGQVARQNLRGDAGATWQGLAFSLDPADYARQRFVS